MYLHETAWNMTN